MVLLLFRSPFLLSLLSLPLVWLDKLFFEYIWETKKAYNNKNNII